jgi:hypothetical protein
MSVTIPGTAADASAESASAVRRPWPRVALNPGGSVFEFRGATLFLRLAGVEVYFAPRRFPTGGRSGSPGASRLRWGASA